MRLAPAALPGTPAAGDIAIDSGAANALKYYDGSTWVTAGGGGGSGTVNSGTQNQLAYYGANGTAVSGLATANNGVLVTSGAGVPSIGTTLPNSVQTNITALGTVTTGVWNGTAISAQYGGTGLNASAAANGQLLIGNGAGFTLAGLTGTANQISVANGAGSITLSAPQDIHSGASPTFTGMTLSGMSSAGIVKNNASGVLSGGNQVALGTEVSGTLPATNGGTGTGTYATGDLLYASAANTLSKLAAGTDGKVLTLSGGVPSWQTPAGGASSLSALTAATATNTIDNLNFAQTWNWSTASTQTPLTMNANALTTGSMLSLATSNNSLNSTSGLLNVANTGTSTNGMVASFKANSTAGSGMYLLANGNVGVGTASPGARVDIYKEIDTNVNTSAQRITLENNDVVPFTSFMNGLEVQASHAGTANITGIAAINGKLDIGNSGSTLGDAAGVYVEAFASGNSVTNLNGIQTYMPIYGGTITNAIGADFWIRSISSATAQNIKGLKIDVPAGTVSSYGIHLSTQPGPSSFGIYQSGNTPNFFQGNVGIGTTTPGISLDISGKTDAVALPKGTTAQQPGSPASGWIRYNTDNNAVEFHNGTAWTTLSTGGGSYLASTGGTLSGALTISSGGAIITGGVDNNSGGITEAGSITGVGANITGGGALTVAAGGTNQNLALASSGTGSVNVDSGNGTSFSVLDGGASTVNYVTAKGSATGASPVIGTAGADANINLTFTPKGTGNSIFSSGNVGIGTTSPSAPLYVQYTDNNYATGIVVKNTSNGGSAQGGVSASNDVGDVAYFLMAGSNRFGAGGLTFARQALYQASTGMIFQPNAGMASGGTDKIHFQTGGYNNTSTMTITAGNPGNVGIGTTAPATKLDVKVAAQATLAAVQGTTSNGAVSVNYSHAANVYVPGLTWYAYDNYQTTPRAGIWLKDYNGGAGIQFGTTNNYASGITNSALTIDNNGNVGIGTTAPTNAFEIEGSDATSPVAMIRNKASTASRYPGITIENYDGTGQGGVPVLLFRQSRGSVGSANPVASGDKLGAIDFRAVYDTSDSSRIAAGILAKATELHSGTAAGTSLAFATISNTTTTLSERMRIDGTGNVGIGTTTPGQKLEVTGNARINGQLSTKSQTIAGGTTAIDWNNGNSIMTDYDCASSFAFANLQDGGTYTLVVTGTGTAQCNFSTTTTGTDAATVTYRFKPANGARTASSYTVYTLMRIGTTVLVSWTSGF